MQEASHGVCYLQSNLKKITLKLLKILYPRTSTYCEVELKT